MLSLGRGPAVFPLLDAAIEADPEFASAHLQRAFSAYRISGGLDAVGRRAYAAALERKGKLSARDAELLNAIGPSFADPPNWQESGKRLEAMLAKRPGDAQAWEALGILRFKNSQLEAAVIAFEHENAADPNAYAPYFFRGHARASAGDIAGARKFFEQCNDRIPTNIECRGAVGAMYRVDGDCTAADRVAREAAALAPDQPLVYTHRAESAAALGATNGALSELLAQKRALMPEARRASEKLSDDFHLAMRIGDFASALAALDAIDHNADDSRPDQRVKWIVERARLLWEMGEPAKSATFSLTYLDRMTAQMLPEQPWQDPTGQLLAIANASGRISNGDYVERRDKWIDAWRTRLGVEGFRNDGTSVWLAAFANVDPSPERATEALAVLPKFGPYDVLHPDITTRQFDPEIGAMFLAAGKLEEAEARLGAATRWCRLVPYVHAFYSLGETRARRGNKVGACEAFATVERTWGRATPKSVTLEAARRAMKKYGCPTVPSSSSKP